jgi:hypothetical protein
MGKPQGTPDPDEQYRHYKAEVDKWNAGVDKRRQEAVDAARRRVHGDSGTGGGGNGGGGGSSSSGCWPLTLSVLVIVVSSILLCLGL